MRRILLSLIFIGLLLIPAIAFADGLDVEIEGERFGYTIPKGAPVLNITANGIEDGSTVYVAEYGEGGRFVGLIEVSMDDFTGGNYSCTIDNESGKVMTVKVFAVSTDAENYTPVAASVQTGEAERYVIRGIYLGSSAEDGTISIFDYNDAATPYPIGKDYTGYASFKGGDLVEVP